MVIQPVKGCSPHNANDSEEGVRYGMTLKDSSAYNIQFYRGKPVLIDTLSFTRLNEGKPWVAYRQFCQHFLAPLALMSYKDINFKIRWSKMFRFIN